MGLLSFFGTVALEQFDDVLVTLSDCQAQWPAHVVVTPVDLSALSDQQLNHGGLTIIGCHVQRRVAVVVCRFDLSPLVDKQGRHLGVTLDRRLV